MTEEESRIKDIVLFAMLLSGAITLIIVVISFVAEIFLRDLSFFEKSSLEPREATIKMALYILFIFVIFVCLPLRLAVQRRTISKKSGIVLVTILTYVLSSVSLAFFLSFATEMVDYDSVAEGNIYTQRLIEEKELREKKPCTSNEKEKLCTFNLTFNLKESFFDAVSGFTTTGLTAFERTNVYIDQREISKIDAQPNLIHIIRATYLWIGGLGIMFFYLYFTPVPSLMMSMGYEIPAERSLPRFIRLEGMSFSLVYIVITTLGILLLFLSISNAISDFCDIEEIKEISERKLVYSVVLSFSSISTGGFSTESSSADELGISYMKDDKLKKCPIINNWGLLVIMILMLAGAMPIFTLHRPLKFFRRWIIFVVFLLPIFGYAVLSISQGTQVSFHRSFDAISAFTTTGLYTSQFEKDFRMPPSYEYMVRYDKDRVTNIYRYRLRGIYTIVLMFIGGAAYSTAGGWGFFNFFFVLYVIYLIVTGKLERALTKYVLRLILSFLVFLSIFATGTILCHISGLFGTLSYPEPAAVADYVMNSAFYEISALSTVGLMPNILQNAGIYYNNLAYWTLAISMLIGRLYYIIFPFLVSPTIPKEGTSDG